MHYVDYGGSFISYIHLSGHFILHIYVCVYILCEYYSSIKVMLKRKHTLVILLCRKINSCNSYKYWKGTQAESWLGNGEAGTQIGAYMGSSG